MSDVEWDDPPWRQGYVAQVRERFILGGLDADEFERDLQAAVLLDEGRWPPGLEVPRYLRDREGRHLLAPPEPPAADSPGR